ncbi:hypothetical protein L6452_33147 [Arctium lappa]|uniref:Uncharacterized protein n=1 Tax=Arctium lappa TaxID=4217 RepID=A0ACB8Z6S8_ARCLA|nr:hypothetical protein L6452_33147 [Arctium lappa]
MNRTYPNKLCGQYGNTYRSGFGFGSNAYDMQNGGRGWLVVDNKYLEAVAMVFFGYNNENEEEKSGDELDDECSVEGPFGEFLGVEESSRRRIVVVLGGVFGGAVVFRHFKLISQYPIYNKIDIIREPWWSSVPSIVSRLRFAKSENQPSIDIIRRG